MIEAYVLISGRVLRSGSWNLTNYERLDQRIDQTLSASKFAEEITILDSTCRDWLIWKKIPTFVNRTDIYNPKPNY